MDELYSIMRDMLEVNYHQKALLHMLEILEAGGGEMTEDAGLITGGTKYYLEALQKELGEVIASLDGYIARESRKGITVSEM